MFFLYQKIFYQYGFEPVLKQIDWSNPPRKVFFFFLIWWLQMALIAICYMYSDLFALQHIADRPG